MCVAKKKSIFMTLSRGSCLKTSQLQTASKQLKLIMMIISEALKSASDMRLKNRQ